MDLIAERLTALWFAPTPLPLVVCLVVFLAVALYNTRLNRRFTALQDEVRADLDRLEALASRIAPD